MEKIFLNKNEIIEIIDQEIEDTMLSFAFDGQNHTRPIEDALYLKALNHFADDLNDAFNDSDGIMSKEQVRLTLDGLQDHMSNLVDMMLDDYFYRAYGEGVNSVIDFSQLI